MPIKVLACPCGHEEELLVKADETPRLTTPCPECGQVAWHRRYTSPHFTIGGEFPAGIMTNPVLRAEIEGTPGIASIPREALKEVQERLISKGDSPSLRKEVASLREAALIGKSSDKPTIKELKKRKGLS